MPHREVLLETAAFLDSPHARLSGASRADVRAIAERVLACTHENLGKPAAELDGEDVRMLLVELLPARLAQDDPLAAHVPEVLEALFAHLEEAHVAAHAFERRQALATHADAFAAAVARSGNATRPRGEEKPFVHGAPKLGRNDPCSCGSGKKYKKCHGKNEP